MTLFSYRFPTTYIVYKNIPINEISSFTRLESHLTRQWNVAGSNPTVDKIFHFVIIGTFGTSLFNF